MRRLWIGVALLGIMLAGSIGMLRFSHHFHEEFSNTLHQAEAAALEGNWTAAEAYREKADLQWQKHHRFLASFTDHEPIEEVETLLTRLQLFCDARDALDFADVCSSLRHLSEAIDESHSIKWWSLL